MASQTETELGVRRRVTVRKCGCKYRAEDDKHVKAGYEIGGYLVEACAAHSLHLPRRQNVIDDPGFRV